MKRLIYRLLIVGVLCLGLSPPAFALDPANTVIMQNAAVATGEGTPAPVSGYATVGLQVTISATATVSFEAAADTSNYTAILCTNVADGSTATSTTASGLFQCNVAGFQLLRARISSYSSGSVTVTSLVTTARTGGVGSTGVAGWPTSSTTKEITWANSLANAMRVGDGVTPGCFFTDATLGFLGIPCTASNTLTMVLTNFTWSLWDQEGAAAIETVDPDAASTLAMWTYGAAYRPLKTVYFDAGSINVDGTNCTSPTEQALNGSEKTWAFSCADSNSSIFSGKLRMRQAWDAGTLLFTLSLFHGTTETITFAGDFSAMCRRAGSTDVINSTYGSAVAADVSITTANEIEEATTTAVTANGTCAAGSWLLWRYVVDAANFSANAANSKVLGVTLQYRETSRSD